MSLDWHFSFKPVCAGKNEQMLIYPPSPRLTLFVTFSAMDNRDFFAID